MDRAFMAIERSVLPKRAVYPDFSATPALNVATALFSQRTTRSRMILRGDLARSQYLCCNKRFELERSFFSNCA
jgi:hypothetical protein